MVSFETHYLISIVNLVTRAIPDEGVTSKEPGAGSGKVCIL